MICLKEEKELRKVVKAIRNKESNFHSYWCKVCGRACTGSRNAYYCKPCDLYGQAGDHELKEGDMKDVKINKSRA